MHCTCSSKAKFIDSVENPFRLSKLNRFKEKVGQVALSSVIQTHYF